MTRHRSQGFTLIELLIVVAIIAILALIAVPNFLEAQVRSKVARVRTDMRSVTVALEAYFVDWNGYPRHRDFPSWPVPPDFRPWFAALTTPVAYITSMPKDPFAGYKSPTGGVGVSGEWFHYDPLRNTYGIYGGSSPYDWMPDDWGPWNGFVADMRARGFWYVLWSPGTDGDHDIDTRGDQVRGDLGSFYDPTNGTVSNGDIVRMGPGSSDFVSL